MTNNYTYQEKPKTVKAVQWDGTLAGAVELADLLDKTSQDVITRTGWHTVEVARNAGDPELQIKTMESSMLLRKGDYLVVSESDPRVQRKQEFESKYQKEEQIWGDSILSQEKAKERGKAAKKSMDEILEEVRKEVERKREAERPSPYGIHPYPYPDPWIGKRGPYDPVPMWPYPRQTWVRTKDVRDNLHDALNDATIYGTGFYTIKI